MTMAWREIHHNFFIDNYSPQENVDNDDGSSYYNTHDNFFVYGGNGMKNDFGGHDNNHHDNIYGYVGQAIGFYDAPMLDGHEDHFEHNTVVLTGTKRALEQATLGKRPADSSEPILDELCELAIPTLTRDSSRRYLKSMGASTFGSAGELKARLQQLFQVNQMGKAPADVHTSQPMAHARWYYPGVTRITTTRPG